MDEVIEKCEHDESCGSNVCHITHTSDVGGVADGSSSLLTWLVGCPFICSLPAVPRVTDFGAIRYVGLLCMCWDGGFLVYANSRRDDRQVEFGSRMERAALPLARTAKVDGTQTPDKLSRPRPIQLATAHNTTHKSVSSAYSGLVHVP